MIQLALGLAGEAGEIMGAVKKYIVYNQKLDYENVKEELGDIEFFMEGLRQAIGITREECLASNTQKLALRYPGFVYSDASATNRKDKNINK
jgi:NTP pyrophosphatase (non-canonical NTP hydrolase)